MFVGDFQHWSLNSGHLFPSSSLIWFDLISLSQLEVWHDFQDSKLILNGKNHYHINYVGKMALNKLKSDYHSLCLFFQVSKLTKMVFFMSARTEEDSLPFLTIFYSTFWTFLTWADWVFALMRLAAEFFPYRFNDLTKVNRNRFSQSHESNFFLQVNATRKSWKSFPANLRRSPSWRLRLFDAFVFSIRMKIRFFTPSQSLWDWNSVLLIDLKIWSDENSCVFQSNFYRVIGKVNGWFAKPNKL